MTELSKIQKLIDDGIFNVDSLFDSKEGRIKNSKYSNLCYRKELFRAPTGKIKFRYFLNPNNHKLKYLPGMIVENVITGEKSKVIERFVTLNEWWGRVILNFGIRRRVLDGKRQGKIYTHHILNEFKIIDAFEMIK